MKRVRLHSTFLALLIAGILTGIMGLPLLGDYLINTDLAAGLSGWHGDGEEAFVKPDGTEGSQGDPDVIPVIKLQLSRSGSRSVYQEFDTLDHPQTLHFKVDFLASHDFQRSSANSDYSADTIDDSPGSTIVGDAISIFKADFWIRATPEWHSKLAQATPGQWVTVDYSFTNLSDANYQTVYFCVPPGDGAIYIKSPLAEP